MFNYFSNDYDLCWFPFWKFLVGTTIFTVLMLKIRRVDSLGSQIHPSSTRSFSGSIHWTALYIGSCMDNRNCGRCLKQTDRTTDEMRLWGWLQCYCYVKQWTLNDVTTPEARTTKTMNEEPWTHAKHGLFAGDWCQLQYKWQRQSLVDSGLRRWMVTTNWWLPWLLLAIVFWTQYRGKFVCFPVR